MQRRKTSQRAAIEEVFRQVNRPLAIEDVVRRGCKIVESLNQATVYRNLKFLVKTGWLRKLDHPGIGPLYERTGKEHHHHFHCRSCNTVYDLPGCPLIDEKAAPAGFATEHHEVFLFGVCRFCGQDSSESPELRSSVLA